MMKTISLTTAVNIAADWHGGQWSALYSFASSQTIRKSEIDLYLLEIKNQLNSKSINKTQQQRLEKLQRFVKAQSAN